MPEQVAIKIKVQNAPFDVAKEQAELEQVSDDAGALVLFQGMVREFDQTVPLEKLELEHFPGVTESEIKRIVMIATERWNISGCTVIHRVGELFADDPIVLLMVTSKHRKDSFHAAEFIMDYLKTEAPFWKKEYFTNGESHWVEARESDQEARKYWEQS